MKAYSGPTGVVLVGPGGGDGFRPLGHITADGITTTPRAGGDFPAWGGQAVRTAQSRCSITINVNFQHFDSPLWAAICGDPLAALTLAFRRINPHWYLEGDDDD